MMGMVKKSLVVGRINFDRCSSVNYVGRRRNTYDP